MAETTTLDIDELRTVVADVLDVDEAEITNEADFIEDLGVDSLMALEIMVVLERKYSIKLDEEQLKKITCLQAAYDLIDEKLGK
ncbi:acyl carrier protein [Streptomyces palmae]|uniref:Acyl carrier protein n=1 Tax=Streptomyces palmae TaxID=1701085 RepID=A0A4Z0GBL6_9ACTN|nr:acyl carrier protein [Streptomyces palmae]TGA92625.1 acyl carrier protein [Streptomyces palmae]